MPYLFGLIADYVSILLLPVYLLFQAPKCLVIGFAYDDDLGYAAEFYTDAACTESYDPYADTASDLTIYVKWTNA